jgi:putative Mn2+ efflux pump MntP
MKTEQPVLLNAVRWGALLLFLGLGAYYLMWSFQSAMFSVSAEPMASEIYKTRALLFLPVSILFFAVGGLLYAVIRPRRR